MKLHEVYNLEEATSDIESGIQKFIDTELNGNVRIEKINDNTLEFEVSDELMNKITSEMKRLGANITKIEAKHLVTFETE